MKIADVAIQRCETYSLSEVSLIVSQLCDTAQIENPEGKSILLKPNILSDAAPEKCITTHPVVLKALIRYLRERGARKILVGDSPGIQGSFFSPRHSKILEVCEEEQVPWIDFAKNPVSTIIPFTYGRSLPLPNILSEVDMVISVAKMKTHQLMYVTGSVKNLFGLVPGLHKSPCHMMYPTRESFSRLIAGLYSVVKPSFALMDAVISMEGAGPAGGIPRHTGLLMASRDCTALDAAESIVMGYDPLSIPLIRELIDRKLTKWRHPNDIGYPLLDAKDLRISDFKRIKQQEKTKLISSLIGPLFTRYIKLRHQRHEPKPLFDPEKCIGCGKCVRICPGKALELDNDGHVVADYRLCIRCYCCHEVCPADAITIEERQ